MPKRPAKKVLAGGIATMLLLAGLSAPSASAITTGTTPNNNENSNVVKVATGYGTCTGVLVDLQWVLTVTSCFSQAPATYATAVEAGPPKLPAKALFGADAASRDNPGTPITEIRPYTGPGARDLVLAKLSTPAFNTTPMKLASTAPAVGDKLDFVGWGRTNTVWVPTTPKRATFNTDTVDPTQITISGHEPADASLCLGDSGAPGIRTTTIDGATVQELAAVNSRSWQKNCIGSEQTENGAIATRVDDAVGWIQQTIAEGRAIPGIENNAFIRIDENLPNAGTCLTVKDRALSNGATIQTEGCGPGFLAKKWELIETSPNTFLLRNFITDKCMTGGAEAAPIQQQPCDTNSAAQQWQFVTVTGAVTQLRNIANGLFLSNNSSSSGLKPATLEMNSTAKKQRWVPTVVGKSLNNIAPLNSYISINNSALATRHVRHQDGLGWSMNVDANSPLQTRQEASWKIVAGLGNARCYSFESTRIPGQYLYAGGTASVRTELATPAGKDPNYFTWCAEQAAYNKDSITFSVAADRFRVLRMYDTRLYQGALFEAGKPEADSQPSVVADTAWKIKPAFTTPAP